MILNVYALLFVKHQYYTGDVGLPPAVCVLDLKKKEWVRRGKVPCVMKKINFPFFNPSYSAFICIEMPPLITHWCSLNCELCLLHSIGSTEPDHSGFPGKTEQTLVPMMHTYCSLSCSVGPLWRKWKRTVNGIYSGGGVILVSCKPYHYWRHYCAHYAINSLPSSGTLNSCWSCLGILTSK